MKEFSEMKCGDNDQVVTLSTCFTQTIARDGGLGWKNVTIFFQTLQPSTYRLDFQ